MRTLEEIEQAINAFEPVEAEEAVAYVRVVGRTCRGLRHRAEAETEPFWARLRAGESPQAVATDFWGLYGGAFVPEEIDPEFAYSRLVADLGATRGCGQDVNDLILAAPLDGREHSAPCPRCGITHTWGAPTINVA